MNEMWPIVPGDRVEIVNEDVHPETVGEHGEVMQIGPNYIKIKMDAGYNFYTEEDNVEIEGVKNKYLEILPPDAAGQQLASI